MADRIDLAREAVAREAWDEAYELLADVDAAELAPSDLEGLAEAAWWLTRPEEAFDARQHAYAGYAARGQDLEAGGVAGRIAIDRFQRGEGAVGAGWLMRAQRHLRELPEARQHGLLACVESTVARFNGELDGAETLARRAVEIGTRLSDPDIVAMGIHLEGQALIAQGRVAEGVALLDEAMTSVVAGELTTYFTGIVYCNVLSECLELADVRRAGEWAEASRAWCESLPPGSPFPAICRINRAELATLTGEWAEAEAEATRASEELLVLSPIIAGSAFYGAGEIRRREGDVPGAERAFARAHELGYDPQPGLALVRLAQGRADAGLRGLRLSVNAESGTRFQRARLLSALVEVAIAAPDLEAASEANAELDSIAREFRTPAVDAAAAGARGQLKLAEGDPEGAVDHLRRATATWQELRLPYEAARARMDLGTALRACGDEDGARMELEAALHVFERLGAVAEAAAVSGLLGARPAIPGGLTAREAEILRLVAAGNSNREIAVELVISEHTVARHVQNIFAKLGVSSRSAATAFAFEHGLT